MLHCRCGNNKHFRMVLHTEFKLRRGGMRHNITVECLKCGDLNKDKYTIRMVNGRAMISE